MEVKNEAIGKSIEQTSIPNKKSSIVVSDIQWTVFEERNGYTSGNYWNSILCSNNTTSSGFILRFFTELGSHQEQKLLSFMEEIYSSPEPYAATVPGDVFMPLS